MVSSLFINVALPSAGSIDRSMAVSNVDFLKLRIVRQVDGLKLVDLNVAYKQLWVLRQVDRRQAVAVARE